MTPSALLTSKKPVPLPWTWRFAFVVDASILSTTFIPSAVVSSFTILLWRKETAPLSLNTAYVSPKRPALKVIVELPVIVRPPVPVSSISLSPLTLLCFIDKSLPVPNVKIVLSAKFIPPEAPPCAKILLLPVVLPACSTCCSVPPPPPPPAGVVKLPVLSRYVPAAGVPVIPIVRLGVDDAVATVVVIPGIVDVALKLVTVPVPDSKPAKSSSEIL